LVFNGTDEEVLLYFLLDNKEIYVYREMADNIGYPKLELGLFVMSKDQLADSLAFNSLKVRMLLACKQVIFCIFSYYCVLILHFFVGLNPK
jgi:uncharacterized membrane protein SpoIIM required for sporulation